MILSSASDAHGRRTKSKAASPRGTPREGSGPLSPHICNCKSAANEWCMIECESIIIIIIMVIFKCYFSGELIALT